MTSARLGGIIAADRDGGDTRRPALGGSVGDALLGTAPALFLLLPVQPVKLAAELVKVFALGSKPVDLLEHEPEAFGLFGLLYKQLGGAGRVHVHLPLLDAAGVAAVRWAGAVRPGLASHHSGGFCRRQSPENPSPVPL